MPYWKDEEPVEVEMGNVVLKHYPKAGKLQVCSTFEKNGERFIKSVVAIDDEDITEEGADLIGSFLGQAT